MAASADLLRTATGSPRDDDLDLPLSLRVARGVAVAQGSLGILSMASVLIIGLFVAADVGGMAVLAVLLLVGAGIIVPASVLVLALMLGGLDRVVRNSLAGVELLMLAMGAFAAVAVPGAAILCLPISAAPAIVTVCLLMPAARTAFADDCSDEDGAEGEDVMLVGHRSSLFKNEELAGEPTMHDMVTYWKGLFSKR